MDDGGEAYLNGKLVYKNYKDGNDIKHGFYGPGSFSLAANDPAILWNKENIIAVRVFDTGGAGGVYGDKFDIKMVDVMDNVSINTDADFIYGDKSLSKVIKLKVSGGSYKYNGKLDFKLTDPEADTIVYQKTNNADFSAHKPFTYTFTVARLDKNQHVLSYTFTDTKSGKKISKSEGTPYTATPAVKSYTPHQWL